MSNAFIRKLEAFAALSGDHRREFERLTEHTVRLEPRDTIVRAGDHQHVVNVVLSGWACRYKILPDGRRQIIALFLPGDMCDPYVFLLGAMDQTVGALTPITIARMPAQAIRSMSEHNSEIAKALWWQMLIITEIQREWTVSLGRRTALERLAHFFCEISERLAVVGLSNGLDYEMPLTQTDLADALGLSTVHVNRSLQELRANRLITLRSRRLTIDDPRGLMELAAFDPAYLHRRRT